MFLQKLNAISDKLCPYHIFPSFGLALYLYISNHLRYAGVESWPSVEVNYLERDGSTISHVTGSRYGPAQVTSRAIEVYQYDYIVDGKKYTSSTTSANGAVELPYHWKTTKFENGVSYEKVTEYRAHYKPSDPSVAVLVPDKYRGIFPLITLVITTSLILSFIKNKLQAKRLQQNAMG